MSIFEILGVFYVVMCTGLVTAALLIGIVYCACVGLATAWRQYTTGADLEKRVRQTVEAR